MTDHRQAALDYARQHERDFEKNLQEFVAIPSISTSPEHKPQMQQAADWVANRLKSLGMNNVQILPTDLHPVVYGEWLGAPGKPTVLIYGHYDVQPVDPIELWRDDPFSGRVDGDRMMGRGASDMKGQDAACFNAVESIVKTGSLPVNVKWILEGEEEIGSPSLPKFLEQHKELLKADFCLNPDSGMLARDEPTLTYGLRGLAYFEIRVQGPASDLHSGIYGGAVHNPAIVLAELVAGMHDRDGRITLPGFYDRVRELPAEERAELARLPITDEKTKALTGVPEVYGEKGYTTVERIGARPTLDVNGFLSGFVGEGSKTVLPAKAMAKVSMRLVPDQDPKEVHQQLLAYLEKNAPKTVTWEVVMFAGGAASISDINLPGAQALAKAFETVWGKRPYFKREGGSVPVVGYMQKILGMESVLTGFGLPDDNLHAPNEKLDLPSWHNGTKALVHFLFNLA